MKTTGWKFKSPSSIRRINLLILFLFGFNSFLFAQKSKITKSDSSIVQKMNDLGRRLCDQGKYEAALGIADKCLDYSQQKGMNYGMAIAYSLKGTIYDYQSNYPEALLYHFKTLTIQEREKYPKGIAIAMSNIGTIYYQMNQLEKATTYLLDAYEILETLSDKKQSYGILINLSSLYITNNQLDEALKFSQKALVIARNLKDPVLISQATNNLGNVYYNSGEINKAYFSYNSVVQISETIGDLRGLGLAYANLANVLIELGRNKEAIQNSKKSVNIFRELNDRLEISEGYLILSQAYKKEKDFKSALLFHEMYLDLKDSIGNPEDLEKANQYAQNFQESQKKFRDSIQHEQARQKKEFDDKLNLQKQRRKMQFEYSGVFIFLMVLLLFILQWSRLKISHRFAEGLIFFFFIALFEFGLLLMDPFVEKLSGGEPLFKFLNNIILALVIFFIHSRSEEYLKGRLMKGS